MGSTGNSHRNRVNVPLPEFNFLQQLPGAVVRPKPSTSNRGEAALIDQVVAIAEEVACPSTSAPAVESEAIMSSSSKKLISVGMFIT